MSENVEAAGGFASQAADSANSAMENVRARADEAFVRGEEYVRENPVPAVLGALGIGLILGMLIARRDEPSARERYVDEPLHGARDLLYSVLSPVAERLQQQYGSARSAAEDAAETVSDSARSIGRKFKFW